MADRTTLAWNAIYCKSFYCRVFTFMSFCHFRPNKSCGLQRRAGKSDSYLWAHYCGRQKLLSAHALGEPLHWNELWKHSYIIMAVLFLHRLLGNISCRIAVVLRELCRVILQEGYGIKLGDWHMSVGCGTFLRIYFCKRWNKHMISPTDLSQHVSWQDSLEGNQLVSWMETLI